jgi:DNA polymerase-3 subunit epsilon
VSPLAIGLLLLAGVGVLIALVLNLYVRPMRRLAREVSLIAAANPDHRIEAWGPVRGRLAEAVNELADRSQAAQRDIEGSVTAATADLERERNRLAALMSELTIAVLVCNVEGQILLYNDAAGRVLASREGTSGLIGLGRSIFGVFDRSLIAHAIERIRQGADGGSSGPAVRLTATASGGQLLRVGMAPVLDHGGDVTGFVLTLDDVTRRAELSGRRDALLRSLTERTRASVGTIRAAIESLLDYPEMDSADRQRFTAIIRDEALALGSRVEETLQESAGDLRSEWPLEDVLGRDLVAAIQRALESELGAAATAGEAEDDLWLRVDSYAVMQGVAYLASRLRADSEVAGFSLDLRRAGIYAHLDLGWDGTPLDQETLGAWAEQPLRTDGGGIGPTLKDVVERHGGEVWCQEEAGGRGPSVRLLLPVADQGRAGGPESPRASGAPASSPPPAGSRPELYDFDLFRAPELGPEWDERRLDELAYTVFDTETTGLDPSGGDEIVSIGAVRVVNGRLLRRETFDRLVDPGRPISPVSVRVHGISADMVRDQPTIDEVLPAFARFASDTVLVGHNVAFDMRFLELKEAQTGVRLRQPVLDTLLLSAAVDPDEEDHSLEAMAARLGVSVVGRHTALGDAILTCEIFLRQLRLLAAQGTVTLGEAREAARRTYLARVGASSYSRT